MVKRLNQNSFRVPSKEGFEGVSKPHNLDKFTTMSERHNFFANRAARLQFTKSAKQFDRIALERRFKWTVVDVFTQLEGDGHGNHWARTAALLRVSRDTIKQILLEFEETGDLSEHDGRRHSDC